MVIQDATPAAVRSVIGRLRAADRQELDAQSYGYNEDEIIRIILGYAGPFNFCASRDPQRPVALIGALPMWPGVWSVWMLATDDFPLIALSLTRWVRTRMIPALVESGAHRAECRLPAANRGACRWLELVGGRQESILKRYGRGQEDFCCYVWERPDVLI